MTIFTCSSDVIKIREVRRADWDESANDIDRCVLSMSIWRDAQVGVPLHRAELFAPDSRHGAEVFGDGFNSSLSPKGVIIPSTVALWVVFLSVREKTLAAV